MKLKKLVIITGGTGGHIFPGLIISDYLHKKKYNIEWIGSLNRLEFYLLPKYNINAIFVDIKILLKFSFLNFFKNIFIFLKNLFLVMRSIKKVKPDLVLGFGGYISFYGVFSAWLFRIPTIIHEPNIIAGLSNRILYYISNKTLQAFSGTFNDKVPVVGNPIKKELLNIIKPSKRLLNRFGPINILILGGSQGSSKINSVVYDLICFLKNDNFFFWHQTGFMEYKKFKNLYKKKKILNCYVNDFITSMYKAYNWADLVICRSGALTISEICYVGLSTILIPYCSIDDHQYLNAKFLSDIGASYIIREENFDFKTLRKLINSINRNILFKMANLAYSKRVSNSNLKFVNELNII